MILKRMCQKQCKYPIMNVTQLIKIVEKAAAIRMMLDLPNITRSKTQLQKTPSISNYQLNENSQGLQFAFLTNRDVIMFSPVSATLAKDSC